MSPRYTLPEGTSMSAAQAGQQRASVDAQALLIPGDRGDVDACPYEGDVLDAEFWREVGFYPADDTEPPF